MFKKFFNWLRHALPPITTTSQQMEAMGYTPWAAENFRKTGKMVLKRTCWICSKPEGDCKYA